MIDKSCEELVKVLRVRPAITAKYLADLLIIGKSNITAHDVSLCLDIEGLKPYYDIQKPKDYLLLQENYEELFTKEELELLIKVSKVRNIDTFVFSLKESTDGTPAILRPIGDSADSSLMYLKKKDNISRPEEYFNILLNELSLYEPRKCVELMYSIQRIVSHKFIEEYRKDLYDLMVKYLSKHYNEYKVKMPEILQVMGDN